MKKRPLLRRKGAAGAIPAPGKGPGKGPSLVVMIGAPEKRPMKDEEDEDEDEMEDEAEGPMDAKALMQKLDALSARIAALEANA